MKARRSEVRLFHESLQRVDENEEFMDFFYQDFFENATGAKQFFSFIDMARQKRKLKAALHMLVMLVDDSPGAELYMEHLARVHRRYRIPPEMFEVWLDSLVYAVSRTDPLFDTDVETTWRRVLRKGIDIMTDRPSPVRKPRGDQGSRGKPEKVHTPPLG